MAKTTAERYAEMDRDEPKWKKVLTWIFFITVPFIASINDFNF